MDADGNFDNGPTGQQTHSVEAGGSLGIDHSPLPQGAHIVINPISGEVILWHNDWPFPMKWEEVGALIAAMAKARDQVAGDGYQTTIVRVKPGYGVMPVRLESSEAFGISCRDISPVMKP